jgi:hypothetical protein
MKILILGDLGIIGHNLEFCLKVDLLERNFEAMNQSWSREITGNKNIFLEKKFCEGECLIDKKDLRSLNIFQTKNFLGNCDSDFYGKDFRSQLCNEIMQLLCNKMQNIEMQSMSQCSLL